VRAERGKRPGAAADVRLEALDQPQDGIASLGLDDVASLID